MQDFEALLGGSHPMPDAMRDSSDLAGIFYTGGTTGRSKGVMLSHGNLMANAMNALAEGLFAGSAVYLHAAPMFHLANGAAMYSILLSGGSNVIVPGFTPEGVMAAFQNERVTDVLLGADDDPDSRRSTASAVTTRRASGRSSTVRRRSARPCSSRHFGLSQRAVHPGLRHDRTVSDRDAAALEPAYRQRPRQEPPSLAGRASLACQVRVVDSENNPVPCGTVGEIIARGDNVMMGYWERPEETARAIVDGWMHTGDGGYIDEHGFVFVVIASRT